MQALLKRPVSIEQVEQIADEIERLVSERSEREVESQQIGVWATEKLRDVDQAGLNVLASEIGVSDVEVYDGVAGLCLKGEGGRPQTQG